MPNKSLQLADSISAVVVSRCYLVIRIAHFYLLFISVLAYFYVASFEVTNVFTYAGKAIKVADAIPSINCIKVKNSRLLKYI